MQPVILAVDLGTTSLKAILIDEAGTTLDRASVSPPRATIDAWMTGLTSVIADLTSRNADNHIAAVSVTGQMHGTQFYDANEQPVGECLIWTNRDAVSHLPALLDRVGDMLPLRIGSTIAAGYQALNLFAHPDLASVTHALLPKDALIHALTGRFVTDPSDAAGSGLFNSGAGQWAADVIEALGIPQRILPEVVPGGTIVGELTASAGERLGIDAGVPVIIAGGDTPVAALGAGTTDPDHMQLMLSTSAQVLNPTDTWSPHPAAMWYTWPTAKHPRMTGARWLRSGTMSNGGAVVDWLAGIQGKVDVRDIPPTPLIALPHIAGRRFPKADPAASGGFIGLRSGTTRDEIYQALLQGIAFSFREVFSALVATGPEPTRIRFGGGGSQIPGFAQLLANVLRVRLELTGGSDLTCDGAAILAASTLGWTPKEATDGKVVEPQPYPGDAYTALYELYLEANAATIGISHRLDALR